MKIEVLENPNPNPVIQKQILRNAIYQISLKISQWKNGPKSGSRSVIKMIKEYSDRKAAIQTALEGMV